MVLKITEKDLKAQGIVIFEKLETGYYKFQYPVWREFMEWLDMFDLIEPEYDIEFIDLIVHGRTAYVLFRVY